METSQSISNSQHNKECGSVKLSSQFVSLLHYQLLQLHSLIHQSVIHGCHVGKVAYREALTNNRVFTGLVLMFGVAPLFYEAHLFFDQNALVQGWFYKNWFFWFFTQREEFLFTFSLSGFFLILPSNQGFKWLVVPFVAACISEIIFQSFQIDHWTDFYMPFWFGGGLTERAWEVVVVSCVSAFSFFKLIQYLVWLFNHRDQAFIRRMDGICQIADMNNPREKAFVETWKELKAKNY
jgi:hypothetical protein